MQLRVGVRCKSYVKIIQKPVDDVAVQKIARYFFSAPGISSAYGPGKYNR